MDPFLLAHIVRPLQFDICSSSPISIRDQMLRGALLVNRAAEVGLIGPNRPLLVVGAGAGGATAAIRSAQLGVNTTLLDQAPQPFGRQAGCFTRWVSPTQYDFPLDHWQQDTCPPWQPPQLPLPWQAGLASDLALQWAGQLQQARQNLASYLDVHCSATVQGFRVRRSSGSAQASIAAHWADPSGQRTVPFGMVISAIGFGTETCSVGAFRSPAFWQSDSLEKPNLGLGSQTPNVLISGGGDGALQDFLRIATGKAAGDIYQQLRAAAPRACRDLERRLFSAEDQACRTHIWGTRSHDHANHRALHQAHLDAIADLKTGKDWPKIDKVIQEVLVNPLPQIGLVHPCDHFTQCYALNRFLILLLLTHPNLSNAQRSSLRVDSITGRSPHRCGAPGQDCYGEDHDVDLVESTCDSVGGQKRTEVANVIIVRHGPTPPTYLFKGKPIFPPRHLLPYHLAA